MKKTPPYGKTLDNLIKSGFRPNNTINLFIGPKSWEKGQSFSVMFPTRTLILPAWLPASDYYWPVTGCDILMFDTGFSNEEYVEELASVLYQHEADIVRFIDSNNELTVYHKE